MREPLAPSHSFRQYTLALAVAVTSSILTGCAAMQRISDCMQVPVEEVSPCEYPEDPAPHSSQFGSYQGRSLTLVAGSDGRHFDFIFESNDPRVARVVFRDIDVGLMTPGVPKYVRGNKGLERIATVDRQWNRQQVQFEVPGPHVEVTGGDGFEVDNLAVASLAKNCLNAGLWEVLLFVKEDGKKAMYYQGWFTFPLGHYKRIWEENTGLSYCSDLNWYRMEHWLDPTGTPIALECLRTPCSEATVDAQFDRCESIVYDGEQVRKRISSNMTSQQSWSDVLASDRNSFATFLPPGRYHVAKPWGNEYWRLAAFETATVRSVQCPLRPDKSLHEIELTFQPDVRLAHETKKHGEYQPVRFRRDLINRRGASTRIIVGGIDLDALPQLPVQNYSKGLYMPMGIGTPPFYQSYQELQQNPPTASPYYSFILNEKDQWIDHHKIAVDGPVLHRDVDNPDLVHMYLLSYERHILIAHLVLPIARSTTSVHSEEPQAETPRTTRLPPAVRLPTRVAERLQFP